MLKHTYLTLLLIILLPLVVCAQIADNLKLKCTTDKILESRKETSRRFNPETKKFDEQEVVSYKYLTDIKIPVQQYNGIQEDLRMRTRKSRHFPNTKDNTCVSEFYCDDIQYRVEATGEWLSVENGTTTPDAWDKQTGVSRLSKILDYGSAYAGTDTYYSGAGDGMAMDFDDGAHWDRLHDNDGNSAEYTREFEFCGMWSEWFYFLQRCFFPFDTSPIDDTGTITNATVSFIGTGNTTDIWRLVQTTQTSTSEVIATDYDQCGAIDDPTGGAPDASSTGTVIKYLDFTMNATGLGWISKTGWTKLGVREANYDCEDDDPGGVSAYEMKIFMSERGGTGFDPKLVVTHTGAASTSTTTTAAAQGIIFVTGIESLAIIFTDNTIATRTIPSMVQ